ncbi:hypothetical protein D8674_014698 [Pyrus ussuriensis x Pyrus communis]|uniref:Tetrapyrrole biosynthesis uroporphyrinogen III synthase domain-containing protein n=1 Tax=Pyrus ussuriensis x Pyrus communis TaxID=2448454 RepID=A0A5N5GTB4_9ROSA|nr:hypothetical protein D8674_014698 [Pyrus ussuriensis x Pyrus communis]
MAAAHGSGSIRTVAFTTPPNYAARLAHLLTLKGFKPLSAPTLIVQPTPSTVAALKPHISPPSLDLFSAVAFPSRTAVAAFSSAAADVPHPLLSPHGDHWVPVRVNAYETRWAGPGCAEKVVEKIEDGALDAIVFTSTAEVEGLLKSFKEFGLDWETAKRTCPKMLVAAHGPITAAGAQMLGVGVDLVSSQFGSFQGVVDALHTEILRLS